MKKITSLILTTILLLSTTLQGHALEIPGYEGGVQNESKYKEVIFITGEPVILEGEITISDKSNRITYNYKNMRNKDGTVTMTRNVTLDKEIISNGNGQKQEILTLSRFRETINANGVRYEASEKQYPWSQSTIYHEKPGVTYFAGNWDGRKTYTINRNQGTVQVQTQGTIVGYDQNWGATQTQTINHFIEYEKLGTDEEEPITWQGTVDVNVVHNRTKDHHYEVNDPTQISFRGGYLLTEKEENIVKYEYNLPRLTEDGEVMRGRNSGSGSFTLDTNPENKRLTIPAMRDIAGHWAERDIHFLASLEALQPDNINFGPDLPMSRGEFARALGVTMAIQKEEQPTVRRSRRNRQEEEPPVFVDVPAQNPHQEYIEAVYHRGVMKGVGEDHFLPNEGITKAEAAVSIIKALGFEGLAPIQQYNTGYLDNSSIPLWAKDAVYLSKELNIFPDSNGYFQPNRNLTKAETAEIIANLVNYLQRDIRYDYRERILNY